MSASQSKRGTLLAGALVLCTAIASAAPAQKQDGKKPEQEPWIIFPEKVFTGAGDDFDGGMVAVANGKISLVSRGREGGDQGREPLHCYAVTAGLVDASVRITPGITSVEQSREIAPDVRVAPSLDPFDIAWDRQVRSGVTTVLVNPPDNDVIGGLGVVLKTAGTDSIGERTVKKDAVLRGSMGTQPSRGNHPARGSPDDFYSRRPTTRMGVEWAWRKAFYDAAGAASDKSRAFPGSEQLVSALKGDLTVAIQAWSTQDIRTAVFLKEEIEREDEFKSGLNKPRFFLDAAAEAWKEPQLLVRARIPVVLPPFPAAGRTGENSFMAMDTAEQLRKQGIPFALSSHGRADLDARLPMQAGYAMQGGLPFADALAAVTSVPARLLGVADRVGTLEVGKDADLVLWSGMPFEPSSRVIAVIVDGVLRYDARDEKAAK
jgi:imidazolonepropionase-like amidohydrolase